METVVGLAGKNAASSDDEKAHGKDFARPEKRFSNGTVHFPDWWITNGHGKSTQLIVSYEEGKKIPKLREPRNLYALSNKHAHSKINVPRWPIEMNVLPERPHHVSYLAPDPEDFYNEDSVERHCDSSPVLTDVEDGVLVYENSIGNARYFERSRVGGTPVKMRPRGKPSPTEDFATLHFESRFESGNLWKAIKVGPFDYQLWLRTDLYTDKYTQWYYFRVENTKPGTEYRFTIMNLMKSSSLYNSGMRPLMYSEMEAKKKGIGWRRVGTNIKYYQNQLKREDVKRERSLYSLSWTVTFPCAGDRCYFAHCYPYTYTDLQEYLRKLTRDPRRLHYCKQRMLTRTLAGNSVYIITITSPSKCPRDAKSKRAVVVTARVHPGETNSSWMMKGLLDYLTSDKPDAQLLRDTFVFKIVPMLNPDGVIVGNYRCSLSGRDLNRNYKTALKDAFPSVWHTKEMIKQLSEEREITLYCDLHGHSRQQNMFMYGCGDRQNVVNGFKERVFPMMLSKNCRDKFCFKTCKFKVQKSKTGTGRVVMWNLGIQNSYTLEATFCGSTLGSKSGQHFTTADYESMGYHLCDTLLDYCDPDMSKYISILNEVDTYVKALVLERLKEKGAAESDMNPSDVDLNRDYISESSTSGSDSSISDGLPMQVLYSDTNSTKKRKKRLKTRKERNKRHGRTVIEKQRKQDEGTLKEQMNKVDMKEQVNKVDMKEQVDKVDMKEQVDTNAGKYNSGRGVSIGLPSRPTKNFRPLSRNKSSTNPPQQQYFEHKKTPESEVNEAKGIWSMRNRRSYNQIRGTILSNHAVPRLCFTSGSCFGLAPSSPHYSLKRWSVRRHCTNDDEPDEEEGSFIGKYMTRQVHISQSVSQNDHGPKRGKSKISQIPCIEGRSQPNDNQDNKEPEDKKEPVNKYCMYHAAMLQKVHEKQKYNDNKKTTTMSMDYDQDDQGYSSVEQKHSCRNVRQSPNNLKTMLSEMKLADCKGDDENTQFCMIRRRKSDSNFPPLCKDAMACRNDRKTINLSGVPHYASVNNHHSYHNHHNTASRSTSDDDNSFLPRNPENPETRLVSSTEDRLPNATPSSSASEDHLKQSREGASSCNRISDSSVKNALDKMNEGRISEHSEELPWKTVDRLRQKLQNSNTPGRSPKLADNGHMDEVYDTIPKSLVKEFMNYQEERHIFHAKTFSHIRRNAAKQKNRQNVLRNGTPDLRNGGERFVEENK